MCFSGTPCQIEGLKSYLRKDYDNLYLIDVVCRAVPSRLIYRKYLKLQQYKLNDRIYKYSTLNIVTDKNNGNYHKGVESDPWLRAFFQTYVIDLRATSVNLEKDIAQVILHCGIVFLLVGTLNRWIMIREQQKYSFILIKVEICLEMR